MELRELIFRPLIYVLAILLSVSCKGCHESVNIESSILMNGSFEERAVVWKYDGKPGDNAIVSLVGRGRSKGAVVRLKKGKTNGVLSQLVKIDQGQKLDALRIVGWIKSTEDACGYIHVELFDSQDRSGPTYGVVENIDIYPKKLKGEWEQVELVIKLPKSADEALISCGARLNNGNKKEDVGKTTQVYFDDIEVKVINSKETEKYVVSRTHSK